MAETQTNAHNARLEEQGQKMAYGLIGLKTVLENGHWPGLDFEDSASVHGAISTYLTRIGEDTKEHGSPLDPKTASKHLIDMASTFDIMGLKMDDGIKAAGSHDYGSPISEENTMHILGTVLESDEDAAHLAKGCMDALKPVNLAYALDDIDNDPEGNPSAAFMGFYSKVDGNIVDASLEATALAGYDWNAFALATGMLGRPIHQGIREEKTIPQPDVLQGAVALCKAMKNDAVGTDEYGLSGSQYGNPDNLKNMTFAMQEDSFTSSIPELEAVQKQAEIEQRLAKNETAADTMQPQAKGPEGP